jgi:hypothetical protein
MIEVPIFRGLKRFGVIFTVMAGIYLLGSGLKVVGWQLIEANGGAGPFPDLFPPAAYNAAWIAMANGALAIIFLRRRNSKNG